MSLIATTTKADFKKHVLDNDKVVLVDFWAEWCPPCRMMSPILEQVAAKLDDSVDIVKLNVEESADNNALAGLFRISSIPNMKIFKDGKVVDEIVGLTQAHELEARLKKLADSSK